MEENEKLEELLPGTDPESQLKAERDEIYDRLLRNLAEFDNYK
jgi:molecular chaperone GrpE (heat shock protein)